MITNLWANHEWLLLPFCKWTQFTHEHEIWDLLIMLISETMNTKDVILSPALPTKFLVDKHIAFIEAYSKMKEDYVLIKFIIFNLMCLWIDYFAW